MRLIIAILLLCCGNLCNSVFASVPMLKIEIQDVWVRPSMGRPNSAAYMMIKNNTNEDIVIYEANSNVANKVEIHQSADDRGVMKMYQIDKLVVPANSTISLKPKSTHIMLMNLKQDLVEGKVVPIILSVEYGNGAKEMVRCDGIVKRPQQ